MAPMQKCCSTEVMRKGEYKNCATTSARGADQFAGTRAGVCAEK